MTRSKNGIIPTNKVYIGYKYKLFLLFIIFISFLLLQDNLLHATVNLEAADIEAINSTSGSAQIDADLWLDNLTFIDKKSKNNPFKIENIAIFSDNGTLSSSKQLTYEEASKKSLIALIKRLFPLELQDVAISNVSQIPLESLIENYTTPFERMTSHSYRARYDITFKQGLVKAFLHKFALPYVDSYTQTILIIPLLIANGMLIDIDEQDHFPEWGQVWYNSNRPYDLIQFDLLANINNKSANKQEFNSFNYKLNLLNYNYAEIIDGKLRNAYSKILIIITDLSRYPEVDIALRLVEEKKAQMKVIRFLAKKDLSYYENFKKIVDFIMFSLNEEWKSRIPIASAPAYKLNIYIPKKCLQWREIMDELQRIKAIKSFSVKKETNNGINTEVIFNIPPTLLNYMLIERGIIVKESPDEDDDNAGFSEEDPKKDPSTAKL